MPSKLNSHYQPGGATNAGFTKRNWPYLRVMILLVVLASVSAVVNLFGRVALAVAFPSVAAAPLPPTPTQPTPGDAYPRMPADIDDRLNAAFEPQVAWSDKAISDPFADKANLTGAPSSVAPPPAATGGTGRTYVAGNSGPSIPSIPDFEARLALQRQALMRGEKPSATSLYSYTELRLVGNALMIKKGLPNSADTFDAMFYALPTKQVIFAKVGARFFDAEMVGFDDNSVKFRTDSGAIRVLSLTRVKGANLGNASLPVKPLPILQPQKASDSDQLQDAVRERYSSTSAPSPATPRQPTVATPEATPVALKSTTVSATGEQAMHNHVAFKGQQELTATSALSSKQSSESEKPTIRVASISISSTLGEEQPHSKDVKEVHPYTSSPAPTPTPTPSKERVAQRSDEAENQVAAPETLKPKKGKERVFCDNDFESESITFQTIDPTTTIGVLINYIHYNTGINFMPDADVNELPATITVNEAPWAEVLKTILDYNDLDSVCTASGIVRIAKRSKIAQIRDARRRAEPVITKLYTLRYLQSSAGGSVDLAGRVQGNRSGTVETLESAVREILRASGDPRAEVRKVPGRNQFFVSATEDQQSDIARLIAQADQPPNQVLMEVSVYTVNDNQISRLGAEFSALVGNAGGTRLGGISTFPGPTSSSSSGGSGGSGGTGGTGGTTNNQSAFNPGGVPNIQGGFLQPSGALAASSPTFTLGTTNIFGTAQFAVQFTAAKQRGLLYEKYNPVGIVADGESFNLDSGTQFPIVIPALVGGGATGSTTGNVVFVQAGRIASIVPQVALDAQGRPDFVTLQLRLENNSVDTSLSGLGTAAPPVNRQSIQTVVRLRDNQTVVVGGFTLDTDSNTTNKVPGISQLPGIGNLFKSKAKQSVRARLYYRISVRVIPQDAPADQIPLPSDIRAKEKEQQQKQQQLQQQKP